jgi:cell division control protein 6
MAFDSKFEIVLNGDWLREDYLPAIIPARESHMRELQRCVSPALKGQKPLNAWLHGSPGTGKTTVACNILREVNKRANVPGVYVNCWKHNTFYSILEYVVNEMRRGFGDARDTHVKLKQLERLVKDRPFLVVLDEVDLMPSSERNNTIYNLFSIAKVGLICISESRFPILSLEERIKSRLRPQVISFKTYSPDEMVKILRERAARPLHPDSWGPSILKIIAQKARGDARIALQTLRNAAIHAESEGAKRITASHVEKGFVDTGGLSKTYELKRLSSHHRLLYKAVKENPGITSPELFEAYLRECQECNWKPIASRTFSLYMQKMAELKLVRAKRARVRGRVHAFWVWE